MNTTYKAIELSGPGKFSEELFEVAHKYEFADFQKAVSTRPVRAKPASSY